MMLSDSDPLAANLLPRGIILYGPPASGKTFLCRVIGNSLDRNVVFASVADIVSKVVGETERKISDLFTQARSRAPSVLVFDPIDPFAKRRVGHESGFSADQVLTALLTELDGLGSHNRGVLVVATAHNIDALDEAVLRSGRLELHIRLLEPSVSDMVALLLRRCANATLTVSASDAEKCIVNAKCITFADVESLYQETVMRYIRSLDRATATVAGLEEAFSRLAVSTQPIVSPTVPDPKSCTPQ
jgi:transitional endoplasmic reticulum ATPase